MQVALVFVYIPREIACSYFTEGASDQHLQH